MSLHPGRPKQKLKFTIYRMLRQAEPKRQGKRAHNRERWIRNADFRVRLPRLHNFCKCVIATCKRKRGHFLPVNFMYFTLISSLQCAQLRSNL